MISKAYITASSKYLPNKPVSNEEMEEYLGLINGSKSRSKNIILRNNKITSRYYAIDKKGNSTHSNTDITVEAIQKLFDDHFKLNDIELLACGTTSPDQLLPGHASMVHGKLKCNPIEIISASGSCNAGMSALKYGYYSLITGNTNNAVCTGSEKLSTWLLSKNFEEETAKHQELGKNPYIAFENEFLRWMLSDGAGAVLMENKPAINKTSLKVEWIDIKSYANEVDTCMYAGGIKKNSSELMPWRDCSLNEIISNSVFSLKQDVKLLEENIVKYGGRGLVYILDKYNLNINDIDHFIPHISSYFFKEKIYEEMKRLKIPIPLERWSLNLERVGNVGSASIYLILEELFNSGKLNPGEKLLVMVPESARFSYTYALLTVV